ncbi:hypothetical protein D3C85_1679140 [compost metagenome]
MQRLLAVNNNLTAVFKAERQYAAVDLTIDIAVAIPVVQTLFNGLPQGIGQAMEFTVIHGFVPVFRDGGSITLNNSRCRKAANSCFCVFSCDDRNRKYELTGNL